MLLSTFSLPAPIWTLSSATPPAINSVEPTAPIMPLLEAIVRGGRSDQDIPSKIYASTLNPEVPYPPKTKSSFL